MNTSEIARLLNLIPKTSARQILVLVKHRIEVKELVNYLYREGFTTDFRNSRVSHADGWAYIRSRDNKHSFKYSQYSDLILPADLDEDGKRMVLARWRLGATADRNLFTY